MDTKRFVIGTIVGGIVLFFVGYLVYEVILGSFMEASSPNIPGVNRETPLYVFVGLGCLVQAALICYAMGRRGATGLAAGATVGAITGVLLWGTADLMIHGLTNLISPTGIVVDLVGSLVTSGVTGAVIGLVDSKLKPAGA